MTLRGALLAMTIVGFQSHWVDDVGSAGPDYAGIIISLLGTAVVGAGLLAGSGRVGRALLMAGLGLVVFISLADLSGLQPDGAFAPDTVAHWRTTLGWPVTAAVLVTLLSAVSSLQLRRRRPNR